MSKWLAVLILVPRVLAAQTADAVDVTNAPKSRAETATRATQAGTQDVSTASPPAGASEDAPVRITPEELAARALEISARESALRELELRVAGQILELERLKAAALAVLEPEREAREAELTKLVGFYQGMKPKQAAALLEKLPLPLATEIVARMKRREAANILNVMVRTRAAEISQRMTRSPQ
jgi:flagellar motility protein MotE (MotC chaperone)